jgi:glycosyltransferase involved in cell wall biosynthesis
MTWPLRITIVQGAFFPVPPVLGGAVEKFWERMGCEFASRGHTVTHVSRAYPGLPAEESRQGVRHVRVPGSEVPSSLVVLKALDLIYTARVLGKLPEADILVSNTFWLPLLARDRSRGAVVVDVQRMPKGQMKFYPSSVFFRANSWAVREAVFRELPSSQSRLVTIPNALPFSPAMSAGNPPGTRQVLYVGRIHPEKGLELLVKASAFLPEGWSVKILGPHRVTEGGGGESYLDALRSLAAGLPVEFAAPVYDPALLSGHYAASELFAYPSVAERGETFGLAPLEAMAHGCVPVVSALDCFLDFLVPSVNGMVFDHRSPEGAALLGRALHALATDGELRQRLASEARRVVETHSPEAVAIRFLDYFQGIAGVR